MTVITQAYASLDAAMSQAAPIGLAEFHGSLCAALCVGGVEAGRALVEESLADWGDAQATRTLAEPLAELQARTWRALAGGEMKFAPALPDDDDELQSRVSALSLWCHGFVSGLGLAGYDFTVEGSEGEVAEIVGDLTEISRATLDAYESVHAEQAESSFAELVEYVRIGVQIVYEELGERRGDHMRPTVH